MAEVADVRAELGADVVIMATGFETSFGEWLCEGGGAQEEHALFKIGFSHGGALLPLRCVWCGLVWFTVARRNWVLWVGVVGACGRGGTCVRVYVRVHVCMCACTCACLCCVCVCVVRAPSRQGAGVVGAIPVCPGAAPHPRLETRDACESVSVRRHPRVRPGRWSAHEFARLCA